MLKTFCDDCGEEIPFGKAKRLRFVESMEIREHEFCGFQCLDRWLHEHAEGV